jgi:phosphoglycolate phosphatase
MHASTEPINAPSTPELVVFDLDGTLVDTLPASAEACNAVLEEAGLPGHPREAYRRFAGDGATVLIQRATGHRFDDDPARIADLMRRFRERDEKADEDLAHPYEGITSMLSGLLERDIPLAILSNKEHDEAVALVEKRFGREPFVEIMGHDGRFPLKPDPGSLFHIIKHANTTPARTIYVGDTDTDMRTGRAAGAFVVGCAWGFRDAEELESTGADVVIHRPTDLVGLIDRAPRG